MNARSSATPTLGLSFFCLSTVSFTLSLRGRGKGEGVIIGLVLLLLSDFACGAETTYKIRIGFPSLAFSYMPFYVAQEKGIYKKYNIESEYIQMGTTIQPQAVVAGNINYFTSVSTGISAAVAGLPLVIVISFCDSSPWVLVTNKDINKPQDLIGKTVALSGVRTSPYYFFQAFLKKSEINKRRSAPSTPAAQRIVFAL
jgi:ABC-type nitrate/sulfonate/bicarbonate transport system substrate-binding protein